MPSIDGAGEELPPDSARYRLATEHVRWLRVFNRPLGSRASVSPLLEPEFPPAWDILPRSGWASQMPGVRALRSRDAFFRRSLAVGDVFAAYLALGLASMVVAGGQALQLRPAAVLVAPFVILVSKALGLYDRDQHRLSKTTIDEAPSLLHLAVFYAFTVWLLQGLVLGGDLSRAQVFALTISSFALTMICRAAMRALALKLNPPERCLVIGDAMDAERTRHKLAGASAVNAVMIGRVSLSDGEQSGFSLGDFRSLPQVVSEHTVERVIIAPDGYDQDEILHCIRLVKALGVKVSVLPRLLEVIGTSSVVDDLAGTILLGVRQYGLSKSSEILKRMTDIVASVAVLVVLAPLFVLVAVAIRLDSPGSPFFRQSRIGRSGKRFSMLKFRSMVQDADELKDHVRRLNEAQGGLFKVSADPRITRLGQFLRRTSLDELPQLLNVLKGDMSLVGPRPLVQDEDALIQGWQRRRLAVRPGMTGLWQIFGSSRIPLPEMVKIDYLYGANWSLWLDLKILIRTIPHVLGRRGL